MNSSKTEYLIKLDTISLKKRFNTYCELNDLIDNKDFIINKDCFIDFNTEPQETKQNNIYYFSRVFKLKQNIKNQIYGLEKLELKQGYCCQITSGRVDKTIKKYVPIMYIMLTCIYYFLFYI